MSSKYRKTIVLTGPLILWLEKEAERLGVSLNEIVRRILDKARTGELNPVEQVSEAESRMELASAQYVLGIVSGQVGDEVVHDSAA